MCTPWTITRLLRWRARSKKDCASCVLACRFPSDDQPADDHRSCPATPQLPINMAFEIHEEGGDSRSNERIGNKTMSSPSPSSRHKKSSTSSARRRHSHDPKQIREATASTSTSSVTSRQVGNSSDEDSSCRQMPHLEDDEDQDYIVFCFKEDGAFDVVTKVEVEGQNSHNSIASTSSRNYRQINEKLHYDRNTNIVAKCSNEEKFTGNDTDEEQNQNLDTKASSAGSMVEVSVESSDSNQSDRSTASFAFPVLGVEWTGSPVQMPKPEGMDLRKHKARCIGIQFQCCRF